MAIKNNIDFRFNDARSNFFLKKPSNVEIPEGFTWTCGHCETVNELKKDQEQYCPKCGTRLRIQDRYDDPNKPNEEEPKFTLIRVGYMRMPNSGDSRS